VASSNVLTWNDFELNACQAVAFTPDEEISPVKIIQNFLPNWAERFDAEPVVLPASDLLTKETPRIILQNKRTHWRCHMASGRTDIFWQKNDSLDPGPTLASFLSETAEFLVDYRQFLQARVGRLAALVSRRCAHESPGLFLSRYFCKQEIIRGPLNRPESFEIHARKSYVLGGKFKINSWVRNKTGVLPPPSNRHIVLVEQDLNTLSEDAQTLSFENADIRDFFSTVASEFDSILAIYYPAI